jgi:zinc/manganese transport system substrate-binding protein
MKNLNKRLFLTITTLFISMSANALIKIVAAENTYGEVAKELGGPYVQITTILSNPSQDPHLFTTTPSTARAINQADIVIFNGADYDAWMTSILNIQGQKKRAVINVASLVNIQPGENPHIWYLPITMPFFAQRLTAELIALDPPHHAYFTNQLKQFNDQYQIISARIKKLHQQLQNTPVIATESIFGYMANSLGLIMHGEGFQNSVMNDVPPSISQIKSFEDDLTHHHVRLLIYNNQVINPLTEHMRLLAEKEHIPVLGVGEMIPLHLTYIQWIMSELDALEKALLSSKEHKK